MNNKDEHPKASILVTGATGLSGSIVIKELAKQNTPVKALVRNIDKAKKFEAFPNVEICVGDMLKPETLKLALDGVEKILMISSAFEKMIETQQTFTNAAKDSGVKHIIKYSGADSGVGFNSQNFISQKEHENLEDYVVNSGLDWTILRPSQFMQFYLPGTSTGVTLEENALILPINKAKLSPVDIADVAKVCACLLTQDGHQNKIYEMTGPDALTMTEACEIISEIIGRKITYLNISLEDYKKTFINRGAPEKIVRVLEEISRERAKCLDSHIKLETHKRFGVRPTNFAEFIYKNAFVFGSGGCASEAMHSIAKTLTN
ncbi:MAG: SDR family oxidoreductase [Ginsengibacter sp.]